MEQLKLHTPDLTKANVEKLASLFPQCVVEAVDENGKLVRQIDFDLLRQELSDRIVEGPAERYRLDWPGKREALLAANAPIAKTLRPAREESVNFDTTRNLFIEGDNLETLKLIQETYLDKVKLIYIDPPYNTGHDFIYNDDFAETANEYLRRSDQMSDDGGRLVANSDSNGRFHSDWLSMIYPRLRLARNVLRGDGILFVSIDDNEYDNLRKACDEVFGAANFIGTIVWEKMYTTKNDASLISGCHDYILAYAKQISSCDFGKLQRTDEMNARYTNPDNDPRGPWKPIPLYADGERKNGRFKITGPTGRVFEPQSDSHWRYVEKDVVALIADNRVSFGRDGDAQPNLKRFLSELKEGVKPKTLWTHKEVGSNDSANREVKELFGGEDGIFSFPKPTRLIRRMLELGATDSDAIILDFFAGSGTTAHAVLQLNAQDGGKRRFIMCQLPEPCDEKSNAFKAGFRYVSDISKERIRRAGTAVGNDEQRLNGDRRDDLLSGAPQPLATTTLDTGFRVLKVDSSNMHGIYYRPDEVQQETLLDAIDNIKPDRTGEDLLFQVLIDWGVDLALPIGRETLDGKSVYFVDGNALAACFEREVTENLVRIIAARHPLRAVFRDAGFANDSVKINAEQIFKLLSPATEVKVI